MRSIVVIAHNLRSTHNVGSLLRTAEGLGVERIYFTGYTPYPARADDTRLPHIVRKLDQQISKTALGAESLQPWQHHADLVTLLQELRARGYTSAALEQAADAHPLPNYLANEKTALIIGRETEGIEPEVLAQCDLTLEIPMFGRKESFNVIQAAAMALYHLRFTA